MVVAFQILVWLSRPLILDAAEGERGRIRGVVVLSLSRALLFSFLFSSGIIVCTDTPYPSRFLTRLRVSFVLFPCLFGHRRFFRILVVDDYWSWTPL